MRKIDDILLAHEFSKEMLKLNPTELVNKPIHYVWYMNKILKEFKKDDNH